MATKAIGLLAKDDTSNTLISIVDTDTDIDTLWTLAANLVDGYMDFTSVGLGYARWAQGYDDPILTPDGAFTGQGAPDGAQTFDAGYLPPNQIGDSLPIDGAGDLAAVQLMVNQIRLALLNSGIVQPLSTNS